jgi:hypothetical protein
MRSHVWGAVALSISLMTMPALARNRHHDGRVMGHARLFLGTPVSSTFQSGAHPGVYARGMISHLYAYGYPAYQGRAGRCARHHRSRHR